MNSQLKKEAYLLGGKQCFDPPVHPQALMLHDEQPEEPSEKFLQAPYDSIRQLIRLLQCPVCSKPFTSPVFLPCSHTVCRACLPNPNLRTNISYPNSHLLAVICPLKYCGAEHATAEYSVDVAMNKLLEMFKKEIPGHATSMVDTPILLEEVLQDESEFSTEEKNATSEPPPRSQTLHGGRLVSTFMMAEMGELRYSADVRYQSLSANGDDYIDLDSASLQRMRDVAQRELDCLVCYNMMLEPTTTSCGHTFCRACLLRIMDHNSLCPVCRQNPHMSGALQNDPINNLLNSLLIALCPDLVAARRKAVEMEGQVGPDDLHLPLFVCTLSLPTMPTFLHIFEPRYRLMMRRCLEGNRRFGMVMYNRTNAPQGNLGHIQFLEYGTVLEIISYELLDDGRSYVETRGIGRFRILSHNMLDGYAVGHIERIEDLSLAEEGLWEQRETTAAHELAVEFQQTNPGAPLPYPVTINLNSTQELLDKCMQFIREMRQASAPWLSSKIVQVYGDPPSDPAIFPYWFASVLPISEEEKYVLLHTTRVRERLKIVYKWIERIRAHRWPSGNSCNIL